jgi:hypothetical protein
MTDGWEVRIAIACLESMLAATLPFVAHGSTSMTRPSPAR